MSVILADFTALVVTNAPAWLASLRGTILKKSQEFAIDKVKQLGVGNGVGLVQRLSHLDEKEQLRHLEQALRNATERGLAAFQNPQERNLYRAILQNLSQQGALGKEIRHEVMQFFTLVENPGLATLNAIYNRYQRLDDANNESIDAAPYLNSFFSALISELYADSYFRLQLSDVLQVHASVSTQRSLIDVVDVLKNIHARLDNDYSAEDFARDVAIYNDHIESIQRNLKIIGIVPKDRIADPEIGEIFVPLRIALKDQRTVGLQSPDTIVAALEQTPYLVLLGGPGSGKSTATKHLAWSHAAANQSLTALAHTPLLSGNPLPLRIELRRLNEERKHANYDFLSFATEVLLKREGITINPQMFKELLTRRCLLLLFDGLDEVATLNERRELVQEIEHFAVSYPGNRVLVTSRPIGYNLSRISHPLFFHAEVQSFDDRQIQQFLQNWYTAVLRLSPIPQREQEELDLLLITLKENPRIHKLAENPLLLTAITQLHRYERLPDRRVLVYDRCADLLLETWAKLRGTHRRWQDMRMVKEDQYACVAYMGFVLHKRAQEEQPTDRVKTEQTAVDVPSRFLYHCVEEFLKERELVLDVAEQQSEARRFIALVQEEAGLIVERGTDEHGEPLYGFVHRTFQEYFAATDVYERYQQEEDSTIVSEFLCEYLHDPHWREVISLLLGKLKSKPVTNQLRQILEGKIQSLRSCYTNIVQQDLFFVCDCLIEEIKVENSLIDLVVSRLCDVVRNGWFPSQQQMALEYLGKLMRTRQCAGRGKNELVEFATKAATLDVATRLYIVQILYLHSPTVSEGRQLADYVLAKLIERTDLSVEQIRKTVVSLYYRSPKGWRAWERILTKLTERTDLSAEQMRETAIALYDRSPEGSEAELQAGRVLTKLMRRTDLSVEQMRETAIALCDRSPEGSEAWNVATGALTKLVERADLPVEQMQEIALFLYERNFEGSEAWEVAAGMLIKLMGGTDLSVEQMQETAMALYDRSPEGSEAWEVAEGVLAKLVERADLSVERMREMAVYLYYRNPKGGRTRELATRILTKLMERTDLPVEQVQETVIYLYERNFEGSEAWEVATGMLMKLVERTDLSVEQMQETAMALYDRCSEGSEAWEVATGVLTKLVERTDLSVEQIRKTAVYLYYRSSKGWRAREVATRILTKLMERTDLSVEQMQETAIALYDRSPEGSEAEQRARKVLTKLMERTDLSVEQMQETAMALYDRSPEGSEAWNVATGVLTKLMERTDLSVEQIRKTAVYLYYRSSKGWRVREVATRILTKLMERTDLSVEQMRETAIALYDRSLEGSEAEQRARKVLTKLMERTDLSVEQMREIAIALYNRSPEGSDAWEVAARVLTKLVGRTDLSVEQMRETAIALYDRSLEGSEAEQRARKVLTKLMERTDLSVEQMREIAIALYNRSPEGSEAWEVAARVLTKLMRRTDLSVEQMRETAIALYDRSPEGSDAEQRTRMILIKLMERTDLSAEQMRETAMFLYARSFKRVDARELAMRILTKLVERTDLSVEQIRETAELLYIRSPEGSTERLFATSVMLTLLSHIEKNKMTQDVYYMLRNMVPQFHKLALVEERSQS